jgi:hypothetical protein
MQNKLLSMESVEKYEHLMLVSIKIVALRKSFIDRLESYDSNRAKTFVFIAHKNVRKVLHLFPHFPPTICPPKTASKNSPDICQLTSSLY